MNKKVDVDRFYLVNEKNEEIECASLFTFLDIKNTEYCVYNDLTVNEDGTWNIYVAKMSEQDGAICFSDVEDEVKLDEIDRLINEVIDAINDDTINDVLKKYGYCGTEGGDANETENKFDEEN